MITRYLAFASGETLPFTVESGDVYLNSDINIEMLRWYINNNLARPRFRIFVLYPDETINYEIPPDDIQIGGSYSENYQNGQRRTLSFTLYNDSGRYTPDINTFWAGTRLRFDMGIQISSSCTYWFQKGVFIITNVTPSLSSTNRTVAVSAGDKFSLFETATGKLEGTFEIPYGTEIEAVIRDILKTNTGSGYVLDPQTFIYNHAFAGKKTQVKIAHNAGETYGAILLDLAAQLSAEIFYNSHGNLVVVPINEVIEDVDKPLVGSFDTDKGEMSQLNFTFDYNTVINRVIVIGTSSTGGTFTAEARNDDAGSPLCYQRIGLRTGEIINDSAIYSRVLAEERADYELRQKLILTSSASAAVLFNPLLQVNNLVAISNSFFDLKSERFLVQSVSCSLDFSNQMTITFSNLKNLPFTMN